MRPGGASWRTFRPMRKDDLEDEIAWDEMSLTESAKLSDDDVRAIHPTLHVREFMSSLHLNLADGYRRLGRFDEASRQLELSLAAKGALTGDRPEQVTYRDMIVTGQQRVAAAIEARDSMSLA
jgi:hypothetical protein